MQGSHCEGSPLRSLFTLLMWDCLFADVPNVFQTPYQDAPLDLDVPGRFYRARRAAIGARVQAVARMSAHELRVEVERAMREHAGVCARFLPAYGQETARGADLPWIAACVGGRALATVCMVLCRDCKHFAGGLPDLLLWRIDAVERDGDSGGLRARRVQLAEAAGGGLDGAVVWSARAKLVEVKGPRDRLSDRQMAWLHLLAGGGAEVEVCYVKDCVSRSDGN